MVREHTDVEIVASEWQNCSLKKKLKDFGDMHSNGCPDMSKMSHQDSISAWTCRDWIKAAQIAPFMNRA